MKMLVLSLVAFASLALAGPGCADAAGCADLEAALKACDPNVTVESCSNEEAAACVVGKLDGTCSNLVAASIECAQ